MPSRPAPRATQPSPATTALTGATVTENAEAPGRSSIGSSPGKRRRGSAASSQRQAVANACKSAPAENAMDSSESQVPKKNAFSRFFSFITCCGVPENANSVDAEGQAVPAKTSKLQPDRKGRLTIPLNKADAKVQGSTAEEAKDAVEEKLGGLRDSENTDISSDSQQAKDSSRSHDASMAHVTTDLGPREDRLLGQASSDTANRLGNGTRGPDNTQTSDNKFAAQPSSSVSPNGARTAPHSKQGSDIEMPDAPPPSVNQAHEGFKDETSARSDLPPPPPVANRTITSPATAESQQDTMMTAPTEEKQHWLLPPIQPRFKGKKCLVLDLDETLVHSSFKVRATVSECPLFILYPLTIPSDPTSSRLHHSGRDRRPIPQCLRH